MGSGYRAFGWVVAVAVTAGVCTVWAQEDAAAPEFAAEHPFYTGPDVDEDLRQVRVFATDRHGEPLVGARLWATSAHQLVSHTLIYPVAGADGDWVVYNISSGLMVQASCPGYARDGDESHAFVMGWDDWPTTLRFTLYRGAKLSGRVVDADTGDPIEGAGVSLPGVGAMTDADGHYVAKAVRPTGEEPARIYARAEDYVSWQSGEMRVEDERAYEIPDIALRRGGFIIGKLARPPKADEDEYFRAEIGTESVSQSGRPQIGKRSSRGEHGAFRIGPIAPGTHVVRIEAHNHNTGKRTSEYMREHPREWVREWLARVPDVVVRVGDETDVGTIELELISQESAPERKREP